MILPMKEQGLLFLFICLLGGCFGFLYDILRILRQCLKAGFILCSLGDLLFWLFAAFTMFYLLLGINYAEIRIYMVLGFVGGMAVYYNSLSGIFLSLAAKVTRFLKKLLKAVFKPVYIIFVRPVKLIKLRLKNSLSCGIIRISTYVKKSTFPTGRRFKWKKTKIKKQRKKKKDT